MTEIRQEAMELLERIPEEKLGFVVQIMRGISGLLNETAEKKKTWDFDQYVTQTERGQYADEYVRGLRDNDRF